MRREFLVMTRDSHFFQLRAHARQYALAIKLNHVPLIRLARVDIHDRCATVEEVDQRLRVNVRICAYRPFAETSSSGSSAASYNFALTL